MQHVAQVVLVLSGKGGVGKSTVSAQLAAAMAQQGKRVGLLDIDLCGPSLPVMFGLQDAAVIQGPAGLLPVHCPSADNLLLMSIGFLLTARDSAVIWRGPKKGALITQFVRDVDWGPLDVLLIDTPPGTSDEHITVVEVLRTCSVPVSAVVVTTPQALAVGDVRREIDFCRKADVRIRGLVENMSGYVCPHCSECTNIFSKGGGESLARLTDIPFLGCVAVDTQMASLADRGLAFDANSQATRQLNLIADAIPLPAISSQFNILTQEKSFVMSDDV